MMRVKQFFTFFTLDKRQLGGDMMECFSIGTSSVTQITQINANNWEYLSADSGKARQGGHWQDLFSSRVMSLEQTSAKAVSAATIKRFKYSTDRSFLTASEINIPVAAPNTTPRLFSPLIYSLLQITDVTWRTD